MDILHRPSMGLEFLCPLTQDLLHGLTLRQFIDELIQIADLLHQRVLDVFHAHTADKACNQWAVRI